MTSDQPTLYLVTELYSNPGNADLTTLADGWPKSVCRVSGSPVYDDPAAAEPTLLHYEYPDAGDGTFYATAAELDTRTSDATRIAHNAARKAYRDSLPNWKLSPRQLRLALLDHGIKKKDIESLIADDEAAVAFWETTPDFEYDHPLILQFAAALGFDEAGRIAIWNLGKTKP